MSDDPIEKIIRISRNIPQANKKLVTAIYIGFAIALFWIFWAIFFSGISKWAGLSGNIDDAGNWGDAFGGFSALLSAFGFVGIYYTINLQIETNKSQQIDQHLQRFENTFFNLINLLRELRSELNYETSSFYPKEFGDSLKTKSEVSGMMALKLAYADISMQIKKHLDENGEIITKKEVSSFYLRSVFTRYDHCFAPYFRMVYTILQKINSDKFLSDDSKYYYARILRAQLSTQEVGILAYNSCAKISKDLFDLILYFRMLKYFPANFVKVALQQIYPAEAFASRD